MSTVTMVTGGRLILIRPMCLYHIYPRNFVTLHFAPNHPSGKTNVLLLVLKSKRTLQKQMNKRKHDPRRVKEILFVHFIPSEKTLGNERVKLLLKQNLHRPVPDLCLPPHSVSTRKKISKIERTLHKKKVLSPKYFFKNQN